MKPTSPMPIVIGERYRFAYPTAFTSLPEYSAHRGEVVTVLRELDSNEVDPDNAPMFRVRTDDGWEGDAWPDELEALK